MARLLRGCFQSCFFPPPCRHHRGILHQSPTMSHLAVELVLPHAIGLREGVGQLGLTVNPPDVDTRVPLSFFQCQELNVGSLLSTLDDQHFCLQLVIDVPAVCDHTASYSLYCLVRLVTVVVAVQELCPLEPGIVERVLAIDGRLCLRRSRRSTCPVNLLRMPGHGAHITDLAVHDPCGGHSHEDPLRGTAIATVAASCIHPGDQHQLVILTKLVDLHLVALSCYSLT